MLVRDWLGIKVAGSLSSFLDEILTELQVAWIIGETIQFDQGQLYLFMTTIPAFFAWRCAKDRLDIVGIAADNIKERGFAGGLEVSHTCLNQMACTVEFMSVPKIRPALAWLDNSIVRIEIAIWLLGRSS